MCMRGSKGREKQGHGEAPSLWKRMVQDGSVSIMMKERLILGGKFALLLAVCRAFYRHV